MTLHTSTLLRRLLLADAAISGATGFAMLFGAEALQHLLDVPAPLMRYAGLVLLPFAIMVVYFSRPDRVTRSGVWTVIVLNAVWVAASVLVLLAGWIEPNALGVAFVLFQAVVVAAFAELQYTGLRKSVMVT